MPCEEKTLGDIEGVGRIRFLLAHDRAICPPPGEWRRLTKTSGRERSTRFASRCWIFQGWGPKNRAGISRCAGKPRNHQPWNELVKAIDAGKLTAFKRHRRRKIESIKQGIALHFHKRSAGRMGIVEADACRSRRRLLERLRELKQVKQAEIAGSLRRRQGNDRRCGSRLCAESGLRCRAPRCRRPSPNFLEVEPHPPARATTKASVLTAGGLQVDLRIVPADNFGAAPCNISPGLCKEHNVESYAALAPGQGDDAQRMGPLSRSANTTKPDKENRRKPPTAKPVASSKTESDVYKNARFGVHRSAHARRSRGN